MNEIILKFITIVHILLILFVIGIPFTNSNYFLLLHAVFIPFMILHWVCNDNTCVLTVIEKYVRKQLYGEVDSDKCFTCKLIEPVYDVNKNYKSFSKAIYIITIGLWLMSTCKLYYKYKVGNISSLRDLFII
jgi:hypothetical protein